MDGSRGSQVFLPEGSVTGIGSLPMTDPHEAVEFVAQVCPEVPFWPQLPQRDERERMIEQAFAPFSSMLAPRRGKGYGYVIKREWLTEFLRALESGPAQLDETHAAGFFAFERMLQAGRLRAARALKGQIVGPVTLALQLFLDEADDVPLVFKSGDSLGDIVIPAINWYVTRLALWQIERLQLFGRPVILMLDEPCLSFLPARILDVSTSTEMTARSSALTKALRESLTMIRVAGAIAGLHCCSRPPFATVRYVHPALFSFDAYQWLDVFRPAPDAP
ncbi:MAG: hypothetical protein M1546_05905, partial [Chloroflexi bacterium]|nr:hypothetical protein [Chloroflexota bacterium]